MWTVQLQSEQLVNELRLANGISLSVHLTLPFLTMSIASIPRSVRHAVHSGFCCEDCEASLVG